MKYCNFKWFFNTLVAAADSGVVIQAVISHHVFTGNIL